MRRVVLVNRFFHPDHSATSQMASDLAFHLASAGWEVKVVTARLQYENARPLRSSDLTRGVAIVRIWTSRFGRGNLLGRAIDYATFYASAFFTLLRQVSRGDVIVAMTDPPLISVIAALVAKLRGATLVNWVQDLFPDVARALGMKLPQMLTRARDWSLNSAAVNVVISSRMAGHVPRAHVRDNWAAATLQPVERSDNRLVDEWNLTGAFVVGYSGNMGRAHDAATMAGAARILASRSEIRFLFIGGGAQMDAVRKAAGSNAIFQPYQPIDLLSQSLSAADVHIVALRPEVEGLLFPSKFYGILAVARPVLFIGDPEGEIGDLIRRHSCGVSVPPGDVEGLAQAILRLEGDRAACREMGLNGRRLYESRYSPSQAFASWERILHDLG